MNRVLIGSIILLYYTRVLYTAASGRRGTVVSPLVFSNLNRTQNPVLNLFFLCVRFALPISVYHMKLLLNKGEIFNCTFSPYETIGKITKEIFDYFENCFMHISKYMR